MLQDKLSAEQRMALAKQKLEIPDSEVKVPEHIYAGISGPLTGKIKAEVKANYLKRRRAFYEALADGKTFFISTDGDGTTNAKTVLKVENTRSIGSPQDVHFLRMATLGVHRTGGKMEVNTARTGFVAGQSVVGTEGPHFVGLDGELKNPRASSEISSMLHEFGIYDLNDPESKQIFDMLTINGLSGAVTHRPGQPLELKDSVIKYGKFMQELNSIALDDDGKVIDPKSEGAKGFLDRLDSLVANKEGKEARPLRVIEYKAIPQIFIDHPDLKVEQYLEYIELAKKARAEEWSSAQFISELNAAGLGFMDKHNVLDINDPEAEHKLTANIRKGFVACVTPHALDSYSVIQNEKKLAFYKQLYRYAKSEPVQEWAQREYGIPKGTCLFSMNGKDVSHINFETLTTDTGKQYKSLAELVQDLKNTGSTPANKDHVLMDVKDNAPQPYAEFAPNSTKDEVLPSWDEVQKNQYCVIGAGDSPGTDAATLAQSLIYGGYASIVRGLMSDDDVANKTVELLAEPQNSSHPLALSKTDDSTQFQLQKDYGNHKAGTVLSKSVLKQIILDKYQDKIFHADNIHQSNAFYAGIFSELFEGDPRFSMDMDKNAPWFKSCLEQNSIRDIATPDCSVAERVADEEYERKFLDKFPLLAKIPFAASFFSLQKAGPKMELFMKIVSLGLQASGVAGIVGKVVGHDDITLTAKRFQRFFVGANNIVSGVTRGLLAPAVQFPWQFIGEMIGLTSQFYEKQSVFGQTLRALSNVTLIGRANELIMRENVNLDSHKKDPETKAEVDKAFGKHKDKWLDIKKPAAELTNQRMKLVEQISDAFGQNLFLEHPLMKAVGRPLVRFGAMAIADLAQGLRMTGQLLKTKVLRKDMWNSFWGFEGKGLARMSKNSGKEYKSPHSLAHQYASLGVLTAITSVSSTVLGKVLNMPKLDEWLTHLANIIPTFGMVSTGKHLRQDAVGDPRLFTDINKKQQSYSPEKAGIWQMIGGWGQAASAFILNFDIGQLLFDSLGTGSYLWGIAEEMKVRLDDAAVNKINRTGTYYKEDPVDLEQARQKLQLVAQPVAA